MLRGSKGEQVIYKLVQRVKTHSESEALRLLRSVNISALTPPLVSEMTLTVTPSAGEQVSNNLEVTVPMQVQVESLNAAVAGSIAVYLLSR